MILKNFKLSELSYWLDKLKKLGNSIESISKFLINVDTVDTQHASQQTERNREREREKARAECVRTTSEHILHGRTGLMGALARFLGGPGVVSPPATDSAGSVHV